MGDFDFLADAPWLKRRREGAEGAGPSGSAGGDPGSSAPRIPIPSFREAQFVSVDPASNAARIFEERARGGRGPGRPGAGGERAGIELGSRPPPPERRGPTSGRVGPPDPSAPFGDPGLPALNPPTPPPALDPPGPPPFLPHPSPPVDPSQLILVSRRQEGNPLLRHLQSARWEFVDGLEPDYLAGPSVAVLYLSLKFALLKPEWRLRVLLLVVDVEEQGPALLRITLAAVAARATLLLAWSPLEAARLLETLKRHEAEPIDQGRRLQKAVGSDYVSSLVAAITSVRGVNRRDVRSLGDRFRTVAGIFRAPVEELGLVPGLGPTKVRRLFEAFHKPFRTEVGGEGARLAPESDGGGGARPAREGERGARGAQLPPNAESLARSRSPASPIPSEGPPAGGARAGVAPPDEDRGRRGGPGGPAPPGEVPDPTAADLASDDETWTDEEDELEEG